MQLEFSEVVGYLADYAPITAHITAQTTARALLNQVKHTIFSAIEHQGYPLNLLVERLQIAPQAKVAPISNVWFDLTPDVFHALDPTHSSTYQTTLEVAGLTLERADDIPLSSEVLCDLELRIVDQKERLQAVLTYNSDLFNEATIHQILATFQTLLNRVVTEPDQILTTLLQRETS
ncbi:MAG: condensation domain-containing protein [Chloroflexota bacterium]